MRLAIPNKGRLHDPTMSLLERAGLRAEDGSDRKLYADTVDPEVTLLFARAADVPEYVADDAAAAGVTGYDQVAESGADLAELLDLEFGTCRLVLAAPEDGPIDAVGDVAGGTVATEFPRVTREYFVDHDLDPEIVEVTGATELTPHVGMADAIVDITSTGTTLAVNRLDVVDTVLESSARLFADPDAVDDPTVDRVRTALSSVVDAEGKRYLMFNAPRERLAEVRAVTPGLGGPTVMDVATGDDEADRVAVHAVVDEGDVYEAVADLRSAGASDVLVTEIERLVE